MSYRWTPGCGVCPTSLKRLKSHARKPAEAMGEAWFLGDERKLFHELEGDLSSVPVTILQHALTEISSGISCFGPLEEWIEWHNFLLPNLIKRAHERYVYYLLEELCTAFMAVNPNRDPLEPYPGCRKDVLLTLGRCLMDPECWQGGRIVTGKILHASNRNPRRVWGWVNVSGDFACSMFICLKYLKPEEMDDWVKSLFSIDCPHWRAQLIAWFTGAREFISGRIRFPSDFSSTPPTIDWSWSHVLNGLHAGNRVSKVFVEPENFATFCSSAFDCMSNFDILEWQSAIHAVDHLHREAGSLTDEFVADLPQLIGELRSASTKSLF